VRERERDHRQNPAGSAGNEDFFGSFELFHRRRLFDYFDVELRAQFESEIPHLQHTRERERERQTHTERERERERDREREGQRL